MPGYLKRKQVKKSKAATKAMKLLQKRIAKREKEFYRVYNSLKELGQTPKSIPLIKTSKDVKRLQEKLSTVKEYNKIRRRFEKSVEGFNEKYFEDVKIKPEHATKDKRTLNILKENYEKWKKERQRYVRTLPKEIKEVAKNIEEMYRDIDEDIRVKAYNDQQRIDLENRRYTTSGDVREKLTFIKMAEKLLRSKSVLKDWKLFVYSINRYIFYSGQDAVAVRAEARSTYLTILDGNSSDISMVSPTHDSVYL